MKRLLFLLLLIPVLTFGQKVYTYGGKAVTYNGDVITQPLWLNSTLFLFFGETSRISGGKLYNMITGSSDYLTVAGSPNTFQAPDNATYIAADNDYIWFKTNGTRRTTTTAELIGYDLQRTPVKYDDNSPNTIRWIGIFNNGASLTSSVRNKLFKAFELPILWDDSLNLYGHIKSNRIGYTPWTPEPIYVAHDLFTDIDNTALGDHAMDIGIGWTVTLNTYKISGNKAVAGAPGGFSIALTGAGKSDIDMSIDLTIPDTDNYYSGLVVRRAAASQLFRVVVWREAGGTPAIKVLKHLTSVHSTNITHAAGDGTLRVVVSGNDITAYWKGAFVFTYTTDGSYSTEKNHGIVAYYDGTYTEVLQDNFIIE